MRSLFGTATSISTLVVIKEFNLTLQSIASNFGPIFTVILSYFMLGDKVLGEDILLLIVVMSGIAIKFYPQIFDKGHSTNPDADASIFAYVCLVYIPIGCALSNILLRKMKGLHFIQLSLYKIVIALMISSAICVF